MAEQKPIKIDLSEIIRARLGGRRGHFVPSFLLRGLEKLIRQEDLNAMLEYAFPAEGSAFSRKIIEYLGISVEVEGLDALPPDEKFEFVSNHPLGGMDGITLVAVLGEKYGDSDLKVVVNDMLMNVTPLANVFLPINKYGSQGRRSAALINAAFEEGKQIVMFPAGLVSRLHSDGSIHDLPWQKSFVSKALEFHRRVVPIHFEALNSIRFYKTARLRKRLGIRFNLEQALLPGELVKARGAHYKITFGRPIDVEKLHSEGKNPMLIAAAIKKIVEKT